MSRTHDLREAQALLTQGDIAGAEKFLLRASHAAYDADRKDLEDQILAYRRQLHQETPRLRQKPFREKTTCMNVNGETICD